MTTFEERLRDSLSHAYDIERELGGGGMSRVFVATDKSLGRKVVIKLLSPELTADVNHGRFRREIQVAAQLQHPHIVTLFSAGEDGELVYYTMPFIRGESLKSALEKDGPMSIEAVVRILYDVVDALAYAHENGVVHRDIKPANILRSGAHALVTDFGVAKALNASMPSGMTSTGMAIGTPAYMSPEQLAGDPAADHRIDIYAVGLLAYELLTGRSPFAASSPRGVLAAVLTREPQPLLEVRPDVPARLSAMVMSCLSKEPDGRPPSAQAVLATLELFSTSSGEIRTHEYKVPGLGSTGSATSPGVSAGDPAVSGSSPIPIGLSSGAFSAPAISVQGNTARDEVPSHAPGSPQKSRTKMLIGGVALLVSVAAGAIFLSQRTGEKASSENASPVKGAVVDPASQRQQQSPPPRIPASTVAAAPVHSQAIADSTKKRAAAAETAKPPVAATADSQPPKPVQGRAVRAARRAAGAMLADPEARKEFTRGATRSGGLLGSKRRGDLQTQIDALQPFLTNNGLTYAQFKSIVQESDASIFDQFGRIVPEALQRFAAALN